MYETVSRADRAQGAVTKRVGAWRTALANALFAGVCALSLAQSGCDNANKPIIIKGPSVQPVPDIRWGTMRAVHRVSIDMAKGDGREQVSVRGILAVERPDRFRLQAKGPGDITVFDLIKVGGDVKVVQSLAGADSGMQQKVQFIGALLHDPELVILDEPFSGLDPVNRDLMKDIILDMKRQGRTVIFSTHGMEHAEQLCDYVMMIHKSKLQFAGTLAEVKKNRDSGIQLDYDGDGRVLKDLPGLRSLNDNGKHAEIFLQKGEDPQRALRWLVDKVTVKRFDYREPSLHEIFVRTVDEANQKLAAAGELYRFMIDTSHQGTAFLLETVVVIILIIDLVVLFTGKPH